MRNGPEPSDDRRHDGPDYPAGLPDHHDPTSGIGGAPPARSALTLRIVLATTGLVTCVVLALVAAAAGLPGAVVVVLAGLALLAVVDLVVVARRKLRGEPG